MLAKDWNPQNNSFDFVIIGSGYGGAITAARLATADLPHKPSICVLERGREWKPGDFPDTLEGYTAAIRRTGNPLGLFELLNYPEISVIKGSGLGGTSLVNANVAIIPDEGIFSKIDGWPSALTLDELLPYYDLARKTLAAGPHPRAQDLPKVQALNRRAIELGLKADGLNIAVNFTIDGVNEHGVEQHPCIDCGDCVTGCNVAAKNTLNMNYLPIAANAGAQIFTHMKVEWIEKIAGGGWRVHGTYQKTNHESSDFTIEAGNVVLSAGSINSTEILMRSANLHGLSLSPALGTRWGGNGDFFGIAYNGDPLTQVLGFGNHKDSPGFQHAPGPSIVAAIRYNGAGPIDTRFTIEDLSFPKAYVTAAQLAFAALRGEDTDAGDEDAERARITQDVFLQNIYGTNGALNHSMLYLCMGMDDSGGYFRWERPLLEQDGKVTISWNRAGTQPEFAYMNEEVRRHARALGGSFLANPLWAFLNIGHLVTAHPLGGCPVGENYVEGVVDQFGRVFSGDGSIHTGLFVADGSIIPSALGVNPFLTISALSERIAARKIRELGGDAYPEPPAHVGFEVLDPVEVSSRSETELELIFDRATTLPMDIMVNAGGREIDTQTQRIRNDDYWKGFFPTGHVLNAISATLYTGFRKKFSKEGGNFTGLTSDVDGLINAKNSLEVVTIDKQTGDLKPGKYILLRYLDPPWQGFYDIFKVINHDILIGRVYLGEYPHGIRMFTFPMTRAYTFAQMTVADHAKLFHDATPPTAQELNGTWRMDVVSNANEATGMANLAFELKADGRLEARYQLLGLLEGLVLPTFAQDHFQLNDFTTFHDEIRKIDNNLMIGKWITQAPLALAQSLPATSLGIFHVEVPPGASSANMGFYYILRRAVAGNESATTLWSPLLNAQLPKGVGMKFDETMEGTYTPNQGTAVPCSFTVHMTVADLNEFIDGSEHEARISGAIKFGKFDGVDSGQYQLDSLKSYFNYLRVNPATSEAEMRYHLEFTNPAGKQFTLEGRKFMQKDGTGGLRGPQEVLEDYTTLYATVVRNDAAGAVELGKGELKFRTFEDLAAVGNFAGFLRSFQVTGTSDIRLQFMGQMRFLAFTAQFVQHEYDPLALPLAAGGGH